MTTAQTFTAHLSTDGWRVLNENGETLAHVPHDDTYGKWVAETLAALMSGRDTACAGWQAAEAELAALRAQLAQAQAIIARGVELMPLDQLSQWTGVRAWQESAGEVEAASAAKG